MAYRELIKNFGRIREYLREFYVYGFKNRDDFALNAKSARTYDDEKRRLESWLGDYMCFRKNSEGKTVFLSIDSRDVRHNPLYKTWKTKSFTDTDITLHFILLDILLGEKQNGVSLKEILTKIDSYLCGFAAPKIVDESTIRKKLNEYIAEGIVSSHTVGKTALYTLSPLCDFSQVANARQPKPNAKIAHFTDSASFTDILNFYSEVAPCGVIGSFLLDKSELKSENATDFFYFKHHYITSAMDSEILCAVFDAIRQKRKITIDVLHRKKGKGAALTVVPLQIFISVQSGRQYVMAYFPRQRAVSSLRLDNINSVYLEDEYEAFDEKKAILDNMKKNMWGVSTNSDDGARLSHVEFTVYAGDGEDYIFNRLEREKRCGTVTRIDEHHAKFEADIFNATELIPWIRTFICRISDIRFSNRLFKSQFKKDLQKMYELYEV